MMLVILGGTTTGQARERARCHRYRWCHRPTTGRVPGACARDPGSGQAQCTSTHDDDWGAGLSGRERNDGFVFRVTHPAYPGRGFPRNEAFHSTLARSRFSILDTDERQRRNESVGNRPTKKRKRTRLNSFVRGESQERSRNLLARVLRAAICRTRAVSCCCSSYHTDECGTRGAPAHDEPGTRSEFRAAAMFLTLESRTTRSALAALPATGQQTRERVGRQLVVRV